MLVPIDAFCRFEEPSSFVSSVETIHKLERVSADESFPRSPRPIIWVQLARLHPFIARAIVESASPDLGPGQAVRDFIERPGWRRLAETLLSCVQSSVDQRECERSILLAKIAHSAAVRCGVPAEEAFWHALTSQPNGRERFNHDAPLLASPAMCLHIAEWCLDACGHARCFENTDFQAVMMLNRLPEDWDAPSLVQEAQYLARQGVEISEFLSLETLASQARLEALREESHWQNRLLTIVGTTVSTELLEIVEELLRQRMKGPWGVWLARGVGATGLGRWGRHESLPRETFEGNRDVFEQDELPGSIRQSRDLRNKHAELVGRIYWERVEERELPWMNRLACVLETIGLPEMAGAPREPVSPVSLDDGQRDWRRAIGELSAGAGHEINNPLGAIAGHAARLLRDEVEPARRHALHQIQCQVDRIRSMIKDLQTIGGNRPEVRDVVPIRDLIESAAREAEKRLHHGRRSFSIHEPLGNVVGNRDLLVRMVAELIVNGAQAAGDGGQVHVQASVMDGGCVEIAVQDTGPGFTTRDRQLAFTPFYSGKSAGRGLGMGLPVAERIAHDHGGQIAIGFGRPTCVRVHLPAA